MVGAVLGGAALVTWYVVPPSGGLGTSAESEEEPRKRGTTNEGVPGPRNVVGSRKPRYTI